MYAGFFGLKQAPFSIAPDPHYLFMSERHREALAHLLYGVDGGGGFVLLSGEVGAGKTTICRCFLEQVPAHCNVAYIFNPKLTVADLLKSICHEFQLEVHHVGVGPATIKDYLDPLNEYLLRNHAAGRTSILIIDEAQNLTPHVLEQLRLLTNLETNERKLLQIVLIGQPELRAMIARPELEQLAQRVIARYHLGALNEAETRLYIQHRLGVAGLPGAVPFTADALARIHRLTGGVPRRINLLCDRAMLGAYATSKQQVTLPMVEKAASEVFESPDIGGQETAKHPMQWITSRPYATLTLGALGGLLLAVAAWWLLNWPAREQVPEVAKAVVPATPVPASGEQPAVSPASEPPPDSASAPSPSPSPSPSPAPAEATAVTIGTPSLFELMPSEDAAWRALGMVWGQTLNSDNPCAQALGQGLQCFNTERMTLNGMRQLDRPGILTLREGRNTAWVLVTAVGESSLTLRAADRSWEMPISGLDGRWNREFSTLWRIPPGHQGRLTNGSTGAAGAWLQDQLTALEKAGRIPASSPSLSAKVRAFQGANGLDVDGLAGPMTFMQINRAAGVDEPHLARP